MPVGEPVQLLRRMVRSAPNRGRRGAVRRDRADQPQPQQINAVTRERKQAAGQSAQAAVTLSEQAESLKRLVERFKIESTQSLPKRDGASQGSPRLRLSIETHAGAARQSLTTIAATIPITSQPAKRT